MFHIVRYEFFVMSDWMRIVSIFWLIVSKIVTISYLGPKIVMYVIEMLLIYYDMYAYTVLSGFVTSISAYILFLLSATAVIKVITSSVSFLDPEEEVKVRRKFEHTVIITLFHQFILTYFQYRYLQNFYHMNDAIFNFPEYFKRKCILLALISVYTAIKVGYEITRKNKIEIIEPSEGWIWISYLLMCVVYSVAILANFYFPQTIPNDDLCWQVLDDKIHMPLSWSCLNLVDKIVIICIFVKGVLLIVIGSYSVRQKSGRYKLVSTKSDDIKMKSSSSPGSFHPP